MSPLTDPDPLRPLRVPYEEFRYGRGHARGVHKVLGAMWRQGGDVKLREQFFAIRTGDGPVARLYDVLTKGDGAAVETPHEATRPHARPSFQSPSPQE